VDAPGAVPSSINCHACGALIDLTGQTALTHIECSHCGALSIVPLLFGNFLLLNVLGVGGTGTVYKSIDLPLNRYLALKILRRKLVANPEFIEKFSSEARAAAAVNHPNIAQVYAFGEHEGQYYLAMELLEGGSLDDRIARLGKLAENDVENIGIQIAAGLRAAHRRGLLNRDIKPGNILFNDDGIPKLVDFGLARAQSSAQPQGAEPEATWGTPYYVAPEKLRGQPEDFRSDIYSLGATLFHALAGRPPFEAATAGEVASKHATTPADSLRTYAPGIHDFTAKIITRMIAKNPTQRYASYDDLIHDFQEAQALRKRAESAPTIPAKSNKRMLLVLIAVSVFALLALIAAWWLL
jgi:serine/threonine protein kinase